MRISFLFLAFSLWASASFAESDGLLSSELKNEIKAVVEIESDISTRFSELESISWKKKKLQDVDLALVAMGISKSGRELLKKLTPLLKKEQVKIVAISKSGGTAGFYENGKIYVDNEVPLIALVATLFHEGTHAVDWNETEGGQARWKRFQGAKVMEDFGPLLLASEFQAYASQNVFLDELQKAHVSLAEALEYATTFRYLPPHPLRAGVFKTMMTASSSRGGYGLPTEMVQQFLEEKSLSESQLPLK